MSDSQNFPNPMNQQFPQGQAPRPISVPSDTPQNGVPLQQSPFIITPPKYPVPNVMMNPFPQFYPPKQSPMNPIQLQALRAFYNNPVFMNNYMELQHKQMMMMMSHAAAAASNCKSPRGRKPGKNKLVVSDDDIDQAEEVASSDEAEFSEYDSSELNSDEEVVTHKIQTRENRKKVKYDDDVFDEFDEEEEIAAASTQNLLEHVYMTRHVNGGVEYLVRFQETPPGLSQWVPEYLISMIPNASGYLERFNLMPMDIDELGEQKDFVRPIAHRRDNKDSKPELLFHLQCDQLSLLYWEFADEATEKEYFNSIRRYDICEPIMPETIVDPELDPIVSKDNQKMRPYQVEGLKWLVNCWKEGHGSILADEMGLGKTIQILAFLSYLNKNTNWNTPFLIVVRNSTCKQWCDEIEKWTDLKYIMYNSVPQQRKLIRDYQFPVLDELGNPIPNTFSFNILLISYDLLMKDYEYLSKINWEVIVLDEGHRIKNKTGKKNQLFNEIPCKHRVILTGTPIQKSLEELYTLLKFVSPNHSMLLQSEDLFLKDIEELTPEDTLEIKNVISPHLLRRSLVEAEQSIGPKDDMVNFISLSPIQLDLIRLTHLHKLWRIKGFAVTEEEIDQSNEYSAILKICSHPFLIPEVEEFYTKKLKMKRVDLLLHVSSKFKWLDNVLRILKKDNHRVLIFSQRIELLNLLQEFCELRGYNVELLTGQMCDSERVNSIQRFSNNDDSFIFLISTRAGSEGLNLTVADTAIIFDPDWNPQNDLQAQARCYRIGQTQKVDVLRLVSFQTYEHEMFIRAQRKLILWLTILGSKQTNEIINKKDEETDERLDEPPTITDINISDSCNDLNSLLPKICTVVTNFSINQLNYLEKPLKEIKNIVYDTSDEEFIQSFPISTTLSGRRASRTRNNTFSYDYLSMMNLYNVIQKHGFGEWDTISKELNCNVEEISSLCSVFILFAFRNLIPTDISYFPVLINRLLSEVTEFKFNMLLCSSKSAIYNIFHEDSGFYIEAEACKNMKSILTMDSLKLLSILEMKLILKQWQSFNLNEPIEKIDFPPPSTDEDKSIVESISKGGNFDPFDPRVQIIIEKFKSDIIQAQLNDCGYQFPWWSKIEFDSLLQTYKNYGYVKNNSVDFHSKTALLSKSTHEISVFMTSFSNLLKNREKGQLTITPNLHNQKSAPETLQKAKGFSSWTNVTAQNCEKIIFRQKLIQAIQTKYKNIPDIPETPEWSDYYLKMFLEKLLKYGIDSMKDILIDDRFPFNLFISPTDYDFIIGKSKKRNLALSQLDDYLFDEELLYEHLTGESYQSTNKLKVRSTTPSKPKTVRKAKRNISSDDDFMDYIPTRRSTTRKSYANIDGSSDEFEEEYHSPRSKSKGRTKSKDDDSDYELSFFDQKKKK